MKRCSRCEREIQEWATSCLECDDLEFGALPALGEDVAAPAIAAPEIWTVDQDRDAADFAAAVATAEDFDTPIDAPAASSVTEFAFASAPEFADQMPPPAIPPPPQTRARAGNSNRRMALAALLVVAGGSLTFAMFRSSAPAVPVSVPAAARKPAAPKPAATATPAAALAAAPATTPPAAAAPVAPTAPVAPPVPALASKWNANNRDWLLNARKGVAFELPALKKVGIWGGIAQPMLVVRCDAGRIQTFVYTASAMQMEAIDENHTVRVSFDSEPEATERWADSPEHDALFAPDAAAFARRLTTAQTLKVSYTPHNAARAVAEFQTHGLSELIVPAAKPCGWKK